MIWKHGASRDGINEGVGLPCYNEIKAMARRMTAEVHMLNEVESNQDNEKFVGGGVR